MVHVYAKSKSKKVKVGKHSAKDKSGLASRCPLAYFYLLPFTFCLSLGVFAKTPRDEGVRADLPSDGQLRIENQYGAITVEVWEEPHVSVNASVAGAPLKGSPIIIKRTEQLLSLRVALPTARPAARTQRRKSSLTTRPSTPRIDLLVHIPERSRAEISTTDGEVQVRGLPASLSVQTLSGHIRAEFPEASDADVGAESLSGTITSIIGRPVRFSDRSLLQTRIGGGGKPVRLYSARGHITISVPTKAPVEESLARETARTPPSLNRSGGSTTGAGTPDTSGTTPQEVGEDDVIRVDTELVTLNVSVVDRGTSRGLTGLTQEDFRLYEDGVEQQLAYFDSSSAPFNLMLLIDLSGSTSKAVSLIRAAALHFVEAARPSDRIAVITFAGTPVVVSNFTSDRASLRRRIDAIEKPQGSTRLYDSLTYAMDQVAQNSKDSRRNAIILMSDGLDSILPNVTGEGSTLDYNELLRRVSEFDGVLYSLWVDTQSYEPLSPLDIQQETFDLAHDRMKELASAGGGLFYEVEKLEDLAGAYERVVADISTVYSLGYRPTNRRRDGKWRAIRVAVARSNAVARGKRGYYAN